MEMEILNRQLGLLTQELQEWTCGPARRVRTPSTRSCLWHSDRERGGNIKSNGRRFSLTMPHHGRMNLLDELQR